jgi:hypothetical protein
MYDVVRYSDEFMMNSDEINAVRSGGVDLPGGGDVVGRERKLIFTWLSR